MNLANLPEISFCETGTEAIEQAVLTMYEGLASTTLYPGDPVRLFLESLASVIIQQRQIIDHTGKQNLLAYAEGDNLDHLGAFTATPRLEASAAVVTMRFTTPEIHGYAVAIPTGTEVSPDGQLWFKTVEYGEITDGDLHVDIPARCSQVGEIGNGFLVGQITKIAVPIDDVSEVKNVSISAGGAETEGDEAYALRIYSRPESFSVAGPVGAYQHHAMSAHQNISDIAVYQVSPLEDLTTAELNAIMTAIGEDSTGLTDAAKRTAIATWLSPSTVKVVPLLVGGVIPVNSYLTEIEETLSADDVRPLTDIVDVVAPTAKEYDIDCTYYIAEADAWRVETVKAQVAGALSAYKLWQSEKLGRDINPSKLVQMLMDAGASRATVTAPVYTAVARDEVAQIGGSELEYGGLDE